MDRDYERMQLENEHLKDKQSELKTVNKQLFDQMPLSSAEPSQTVGEIHSLYQDLFLTDIKREVESAQTELKQCKQEQNSAQREMTTLKKENQQLNATIKRYRKMLQDMSKEASGADNIEQ